MAPNNIETHDSTKPELTAAEARQATSGQGVIYVLVVGLVLVVVAYAAIYYW